MTATTIALPAVAQTEERATAPGMTTGAVRAWLRLGLATFAAGLALFSATGGNWLFIVPLLLLPDISAAGYAGPRVGAITYNLAHNWVPASSPWASARGWRRRRSCSPPPSSSPTSAWTAVGYGLKLPTSFHDTHLGRMGRSKT